MTRVGCISVECVVHAFVVLIVVHVCGVSLKCIS